MKLEFYEDIMSKIFQTFQSPYSLHKRPCCFIVPPSQWILWSNLRKNLLFSGSYRAETLLQQKPLIPAPFNEKRVDNLIVLNLSHII